jgi:hypothetical protein
MAVRIARSSVKLRAAAVRVTVETRVRFRVAVGVELGTSVGLGVEVGVGLRPSVGGGVAVSAGLGNRAGLGVAVGVRLGNRAGVGVAVGATEDSSISASAFVVAACPLPANSSCPAASIPLLKMRIKRCFRIKKMEPSNWMREVQRVDSIPRFFTAV